MDTPTQPQRFAAEGLCLLVGHCQLPCHGEVTLDALFGSCWSLSCCQDPTPFSPAPPRPPFTTKPTPCSPAARCPPRPSPRRWATAVPTVPSWLFLPHLTHGRFPRAPPWLRSPPPTPARPAAVPVAHLQIQRRGTFKRERRGGASPRTLIYHELMCFSHLFLCTAPGCALPRAHTRRAPVRSRSVSVSVSHAWPGLSRRRTARSDRRERAAEQDGEYTLSRHVTLTMCIHS